MNWWRVTFDKDGVIATTAKVGSCPAWDSGEDVVFVESKTEGSARVAAHESYERRRSRLKREQYREQGRCRCGRTREDETFANCLTCREGNRPSKASAKTRTQTLIEVKEKYDDCDINFGSWLDDEIEKTK